MELKFAELNTIHGMLDVQIISIENTLNHIKCEDQMKVYKDESTKLKSLRTKFKKMLKDY
jgi:hypothetical protein